MDKNDDVSHPVNRKMSHRVQKVLNIVQKKEKNKSVSKHLKYFILCNGMILYIQ